MLNLTIQITTHVQSMPDIGVQYSRANGYNTCNRVTTLPSFFQLEEFLPHPSQVRK
jgi:hypothetical protein